MKIGGAIDLLGGGVRIALAQRRLAEGVARAAKASGCPVRAAIADSASVLARASPSQPWRAKKHAAHRRPQTA